MTFPTTDLTPGTPCLSNPCRTEQQARADIKARRGDQKRAVNVWQPIETAPKDETEVLIFGPAYPSDSYQAVAAFIDGKWRDNPEDAAEGWEMHEPTHWMPLPAPPTDNATTPQQTDEEMAANGGLR